MYFPTEQPAGSQVAPVSVLDLENNIILGVEPQAHPHSDAPMILMFLSERCQFALPVILAGDQGLFRPIGRPNPQNGLGDAIDVLKG